MHHVLVKIILGMSIFLHCSGQAADWALEDRSKGWNTSELVAQYFHNSELQTQWAWEVLSHYTFRGNENVLDFGAGDGKLSALMSFMVSKGSVIGVDISENMVRFASKMFPYKNLSFIPSVGVDFTDTFTQKFDLITSFCVFHLVPNPEIVFKNLKKHMAPGAKLVVAYPTGGNLEFFRAANDAMKKRGWAMPTPTAGTKAMRDPKQALHILENAGFVAEHFAEFQTRTAFHSKNALVDWLEGTCTANWDIPLEGRREFWIEVTDLYLKYRKEAQDEDGFFYFFLNRVEFVASVAPEVQSETQAAQ